MLTIVLTKVAIHYAFVQRGYEAIGGEYLIPVLGFIIVLIIEDIYQNNKNKKKRGKRRGNNRNDRSNKK